MPEVICHLFHFVLNNFVQPFQGQCVFERLSDSNSPYPFLDQNLFLLNPLYPNNRLQSKDQNQ